VLLSLGLANTPQGEATTLVNSVDGGDHGFRNDWHMTPMTWEAERPVPEPASWFPWLAGLAACLGLGRLRIARRG